VAKRASITRIGLTRPMPPPDLLSTEAEIAGKRFAPDNALSWWAYKTFIAKDGPLHNEDHAHLDDAVVCFLWTSKTNSRHGMAVIGQCEIPPTARGRWAKAKEEQQLIEWFGQVPSFLITIDANAAAAMDDLSFCALIEHELTHCGHAKDAEGMPKFKQDGNPVFAIRGHDISEFVGIVERYGATSDALQRAARAINRGATITPTNLAAACGTCQRRAA
jgi:hypothetical protein